jgi:hypothetical protein
MIEECNGDDCIICYQCDLCSKEVHIRFFMWNEPIIHIEPRCYDHSPVQDSMDRYGIRMVSHDEYTCWKITQE